MNVEAPQAITSERQGDILQSTITRSPPVDVVSDTSTDFSATTANDDDDDDMIEVAYHEIRCSVSPQVAQYIFQSGEDNLCAKNNLAGARWTTDRILNVPITESELRKISLESLRTLLDRGYNLWNLGRQRYLNCCAHIMKVLFARQILEGSGTGMLQMSARDLAVVYLEMNRIAECETLLTSAIVEIDSLRPGDQRCNELRSSLGMVYLRRGQHLRVRRTRTRMKCSTELSLGPSVLGRTRMTAFFRCS
jgi:hypothetical protein